MALAAVAGTAHADPALWVIEDADSKIYLFGTIHTLRPEDSWRSPEVDRALAESGQLFLEVADADDQEATLPVIRQFGVDLERDLSDRLDSACRAQLVTAVAEYGVNARGIERLRPWLAALSLGQAPLARAGYDPSLAVDFQLKQRAVEAHIPVSGLETAEGQVMRFAGLSENMQVALLCDTLDGLPGSIEKLGAVREAWLTGDVDALDRLLSEGIRESHPEVYDVVFAQRNLAMARAILGMLDGRGVSFVAVGVGHFVGPDSIRVHLERLGVHVSSTASQVAPAPRTAR